MHLIQMVTFHNKRIPKLDMPKNWRKFQEFLLRSVIFEKARKMRLYSDSRSVRSSSYSDLLFSNVKKEKY